MSVFCRREQVCSVSRLSGVIPLKYYCSFLKLSKPILGNYTGITLGLGYIY